MKSTSFQITGTSGIDHSQAAGVSLSNSLRTPYQAITGSGVSRRPIDTPVSSESCYCEPADEKLAASLFDKWNAALQTGKASNVADLYADDAILLPTVSNVPRTSRNEIIDYFNHFLEKQPFGTIKQRNVKKGCNKLTDAGVYVFKLTSNGQMQEVNARYTFVYEHRDGGWKIIHHHSSMMPE
jgi:uncharacterized protein (TIGR02246 family)